MIMRQADERYEGRRRSQGVGSCSSGSWPQRRPFGGASRKKTYQTLVYAGFAVVTVNVVELISRSLVLRWDGYGLRNKEVGRLLAGFDRDGAVQRLLGKMVGRRLRGGDAGGRGSVIGENEVVDVHCVYVVDVVFRRLAQLGDAARGIVSDRPELPVISKKGPCQWIFTSPKGWEQMRGWPEAADR